MVFTYFKNIDIIDAIHFIKYQYDQNFLLCPTPLAFENPIGKSLISYGEVFLGNLLVLKTSALVSSYFTTR